MGFISSAKTTPIRKYVFIESRIVNQNEGGLTNRYCCKDMK